MDKQIKLAADVLKKGGTILYPTDTIWGLGCDATNAEAVAKIYEIKKRAESKSLVTLVNDMDMIGRYTKEIPQIAIELLEVNDAPMTIIYPGAIGLAKSANKVRKEPLRVILNGLGKDAAMVISRINGFTYVQTQFDYYTGEVKVVKETAYSN